VFATASTDQLSQQPQTVRANESIERRQFIDCQREQEQHQNGQPEQEPQETAQAELEQQESLLPELEQQESSMPERSLPEQYQEGSELPLEDRKRCKLSGSEQQAKQQNGVEKKYNEYARENENNLHSESELQNNHPIEIDTAFAYVLESSPSKKIICTTQQDSSSGNKGVHLVSPNNVYHDNNDEINNIQLILESLEIGDVKGTEMSDI